MVTIFVFSTSIILMVPISGKMLATSKIDKDKVYISHVGILIVTGISTIPYGLIEFVKEENAMQKISSLLICIMIPLIDQSPLLCFNIITNCFIENTKRVIDLYLKANMDQEYKLELCLFIQKDYKRLQKSVGKYLFVLYTAHSILFVSNLYYLIIEFTDGHIKEAIVLTGFPINSLLNMYCIASLSSEAFDQIVKLQEILR